MFLPVSQLNRQEIKNLPTKAPGQCLSLLLIKLNYYGQPGVQVNGRGRVEDEERTICDSLPSEWVVI